MNSISRLVSRINMTLFAYVFIVVLGLARAVTAQTTATTRIPQRLDSTLSATQERTPQERLPIATQQLPEFPHEAYVQVQVNIGFVPPLSVGNVVQITSQKRILANVSLHAIGGVGNAVEGVDASGVFNIQTDYLAGVQGAGVFNIVGGNAAWLQGAGVFNIVGGNFDGLQSAGVFNIGGRRVRGVQAAGVFNGASDVAGVQASGVSNHAGNVEGVQIAGVLNTARTVKGAQIGLINTADDNQGVMIGLLNFSAAHGIHVDLWTDEMRFIRAGIRTGNHNFYNLLMVGLQPFSGQTFWSVGYGAGAQVYLSGRDYMDVGAQWEVIIPRFTSRAVWSVQQIARVRVLYGHEFAPRFAVFIGPTFNVMGTYSSPGTSEIPDLMPYSWQLYNGKTNGGSLVTVGWIGLTGGFRF
jgi:hypothetical protein